MNNCFITGGAGFIGSNLARYLLSTGRRVTIYDNFSKGHKWHLPEISSHQGLRVIEADVRDTNSLNKTIKKHDVVFHLASNADIVRAATDPDIDFSNGTLLTRCVLEAMRINGLKRLIFSSGSGVYGEVPATPVAENYSPLIPVSTYGAQKLACEAMIAAYCFMFDMHGIIFRFANVVGPQQTHGVAYDFLLKLTEAQNVLEIMGDGTQSKPYIHVSDIIDAFMVILKNASPNQIGFEYYNVASEDFLTVNDIANLVCERLGLKNVIYEYTGGPRGWKGDVPRYQLNTEKIRAKGWFNKFGSRAAVIDAIDSMILDIKAGKIKRIKNEPAKRKNLRK